MKWSRHPANDNRVRNRYKYKWTIIVAFVWTIIDLSLYYKRVSDGVTLHYPYHENTPDAYLLRFAFYLISSWLIAYLLLFNMGDWLNRKQLLANWIVKALLLALVELMASIILFFIHYSWIIQETPGEAVRLFMHYAFDTTWLVDGLIGQAVLIFLTQVIFEVDQKYSPGIFWDILIGKYRNPRSETRIIMFMDLKDSTPIAESLGHEKYFMFIRDFIYHIANAGLENDGRIYQYVGDEVIFTWPFTEKNSHKCINTIIRARRNIQQHSDYFRSAYGYIPDFRVGIHTGPVTIGEIGLIKKDIAISGEAMNITARIRSSCSQLNQKYIVSEHYFKHSSLKKWQGEDLGDVVLKGLEKSPVKLYALKI